MGLFHSIFSLPSTINNSIERQIYMPPYIPKFYYESLNTNYSKIFTRTSSNGDDIPIVQIRPKNNPFPQKYIVFSHGNGCDVYSVFSYLSNLSDKLDVGIITYDYVGYGLSRENIPTEQGCYDSIEVAVDFLLNDYELDPKNIYLFGQSLGTGITIDYAHKNNWNSPIILVSPYKSICTVVVDSCIVRPIDKFCTLDKIYQIKCPVKIFHGENDNVISITHGKKIYDSLNDKSLDPVWIPNTGHNDILDKITIQQIREVIDYFD
ncbi:putative alpha/beta hydrolase [Acanthamoeba polyphaga mimivirus]|uniref:Alpha/beta hydrolase n=1 Tax=Acanthamoeba polyphaga mimivirus Kroon TaxID=3069720 RepID=A0A0G2YAM0_9VIRU|nr:putative alpha/beta hydrolase [Acanthamoeba polyphaga mimivirus]AKI80136.1 putative alpha/beta hydrolase [Acanthamoeba polyphaga mimivirus Kroon]